MNPTQIQLIAEIIQILGLKKEEIAEINDNFQGIMTINGGTTTDMIKACKVYDPEAFLAGCLVSTTVMNLVQDNLTEKMAEKDRLEGNRMDAM